MGHLIELGSSALSEGGNSNQCGSIPSRATGETELRWDAAAPVVIITGAELKCAFLIWRFATDVTAAWLDAAHQMAVLWSAN
jgi:hypothetical protein